MNVGGRLPGGGVGVGGGGGVGVGVDAGDTVNENVPQLFVSFDSVTALPESAHISSVCEPTVAVQEKLSLSVAFAVRALVGAVPTCVPSILNCVVEAPAPAIPELRTVPERETL